MYKRVTRKAVETIRSEMLSKKLNWYTKEGRKAIVEIGKQFDIRHSDNRCGSTLHNIVIQKTHKKWPVIGYTSFLRECREGMHV